MPLTCVPAGASFCRRPFCRRCLIGNALVAGIVDDSDAALRLCPTDLTALYNKAFAWRYAPDAEGLARCVPLYKEYLAAAEPDDRFRPAAHYHLGYFRLVSTSTRDFDASKDISSTALTTARKEYELGMAAESVRLPFFDPAAVTKKAVTKKVLALLIQKKKHPEGGTTFEEAIFGLGSDS